MTTLRLDDFLPFRLSVTSNAVSRMIAGAYQARFGLKVPEWRVIAVLAEVDGLTPGEIGSRAEMDKMTVSRAAAALKARALVSHEVRGDDRRSHRIALTAAGRALHAEIAPLALSMEAELLAGISPAELAALKATLAALKAAVREAPIVT